MNILLFVFKQKTTVSSPVSHFLKCKTESCGADEMLTYFFFVVVLIQLREGFMYLKERCCMCDKISKQKVLIKSGTYSAIITVFFAPLGAPDFKGRHQ